MLAGFEIKGYVPGDLTCHGYGCLGNGGDVAGRSDEAMPG
jgi:hypothetical protein